MLRFTTVIETRSVVWNRTFNFLMCSEGKVLWSARLEIKVFSFIGSSRDAHYKIPPMDPAKLEYFRTVKEITGRSKFINASPHSSHWIVMMSLLVTHSFWLVTINFLRVGCWYRIIDHLLTELHWIVSKATTYKVSEKLLQCCRGWLMSLNSAGTVWVYMCLCVLQVSCWSSPGQRIWPLCQCLRTWRSSEEEQHERESADKYIVIKKKKH